MFVHAKKTDANAAKVAASTDAATKAQKPSAKALDGMTFDAQEALVQQSAQSAAAKTMAADATTAKEAKAEDIGFYPTIADLYDAAMRFKDVEGHAFETPGHNELVAWLKGQRMRPIVLAKVRTEDVLARGINAIGADIDACGVAVSQAIKAVPTSVDEAIAWGKTYSLLATIPSDRAGSHLDTDLFREIVAAGAAQKIVDYVNGCGPSLDGGVHDIRSILQMVKEGTDYLGLSAALPTLRNIHRFENRALKALAKQWTDTSRTKPLTVILHSSLDANGAFHRDPYMTEVATHPAYVTVLIEGMPDLGAMASELRAIAGTHGQGGKVKNVILAGHGSPRSIQMTKDEDFEMAPEVAEKGATREEKKAIDAKNEGRASLVSALNETAAPDAQIVLNACLTNATDPDALVEAGGDPAKLAEARKNLAGQLATDVLGDASGKRVHAAQAVTNATDMIRLGGRMQLDVKGDKQASKSDREAYIKKGTNPHGCLYAVIDVAASDPAAARAAIEARLAKPAGGGAEGFIAALLTAALPELAGATANLGALTKLEAPIDKLLGASEADAKPSDMWKSVQHLPLETARALVASVASIPYAPPIVKVVIQRVLVENLGGSVEHLLAAMGDPSLGCRHLSTRVNPMRHAEPAKFIAIGTPGWRRMMLLAAKHEQQGFDGLIKKHLMFDRSLRSDALADIEGYATPHEILSYAGVR